MRFFGHRTVATGYGICVYIVNGDRAISSTGPWGQPGVNPYRDCAEIVRKSCNVSAMGGYIFIPTTFLSLAHAHARAAEPGGGGRGGTCPPQNFQHPKSALFSK